MLSAQKDTARIEQLNEVIVKATRITANSKRLPHAISVINFSGEKELKQQLSFKEYLSNVPGVFTLNATNFAQDLRISIRGFGSRSAFGIRGIKLLVDGIPETTPDGQGQLDNLNLGLIDRIEVIRGPSATLYGNASGGVISIITTDEFQRDFVKGGLTFGSYNMSQLQLSTGIKKKFGTLSVHATRTKTDGYRQQSGYENNNFQLRYHGQLSEKSKLVLRVSYNDSPLAEDAGGLTLEEVNEDRKQARRRNVDFKTGEQIDQFKSGLNFSYQWNANTLNTYAFFATRNFEGLLPFEYGGWVDLERKYVGIGSNLALKSSKKNLTNKLMFGYDLAFQRDNRQRFLNMSGEKGIKTLGQLERFNNLGLYVLNHLEFGKFLFQAGLRFDKNELKAEDSFLSNGDQSGAVNLDACNPSLGLSVKIAPKSLLFGNFSTGYETPVLSELSANPTGTGGFNETLKAQKARNYELGYRLNTVNFSGDITWFAIRTKNEIVPYELEAYPDRTFYKNAGSTLRNGVELTAVLDLLKNIRMQLGYTYSNFEYRDYVVNGNDLNDYKLPGIPEHAGSLAISYNNGRGLQFVYSSMFVGKLYTNDNNSVAEKGYTLSSIKAGYKLSGNNLTWTPFLGVDNLFNVKYNDNIRINAFGNRYYEPAPGFSIFGGIRVEIGK